MASARAATLLPPGMPAYPRKSLHKCMETENTTVSFPAYIPEERAIKVWRKDTKSNLLIVCCKKDNTGTKQATYSVLNGKTTMATMGI